jgi:acetyl-CoA acetyltransferase
MREVSIIGVGMTDFGKFVDTPIEELAKRALWDALKDAGVKPRQIETAYCGNMLAGRISWHYSCMAELKMRVPAVRQLFARLGLQLPQGCMTWQLLSGWRR